MSTDQSSQKFPMVATLIAMTAACVPTTAILLILFAVLYDSSRQPLTSVGWAAAMTWAVFVLSIWPLKGGWEGPGLAVLRGYMLSSALRGIAGLSACIALVGLAARPPIPTLLTFAVLYLAMMFAEVAIISRRLQRRIDGGPRSGPEPAAPLTERSA